MIIYGDPPYAALPKENLLSRILGLGPTVEVCEDLFYALLWCALDDDNVLDDDLLNEEYVQRILQFDYEGVEIVKGDT